MAHQLNLTQLVALLQHWDHPAVKGMVGFTASDEVFLIARQEGMTVTTREILRYIAHPEHGWQLKKRSIAYYPTGTEGLPQQPLLGISNHAAVDLLSTANITAHTDLLQLSILLDTLSTPPIMRMPASLEIQELTANSVAAPLPNSVIEAESEDGSTKFNDGDITDWLTSERNNFVEGKLRADTKLKALANMLAAEVQENQVLESKLANEARDTAFRRNLMRRLQESDEAKDGIQKRIDRSERQSQQLARSVQTVCLAMQCIDHQRREFREQMLEAFRASSGKSRKIKKLGGLLQQVTAQRDELGRSSKLQAKTYRHELERGKREVEHVRSEMSDMQHDFDRRLKAIQTLRTSDLAAAEERASRTYKSIVNMREEEFALHCHAKASSLQDQMDDLALEIESAELVIMEKDVALQQSELVLKEKGAELHGANARFEELAARYKQLEETVRRRLRDQRTTAAEVSTQHDQETVRRKHPSQDVEYTVVPMQEDSFESWSTLTDQFFCKKK